LQRFNPETISPCLQSVFHSEIKQGKLRGHKNKRETNDIAVSWTIPTKEGRNKRKNARNNKRRVYSVLSKEFGEKVSKAKKEYKDEWSGSKHTINYDINSTFQTDRALEPSFTGISAFVLCPRVLEDEHFLVSNIG